MDFAKTLTEKTDEQLYGMLAHTADYMPEAIQAARVEIQRRNLSPTAVAELESHSQSILDQEAQTAQQPLSWLVKFLLVLFGFTLLQILVAGLVAQGYRAKGYRQKYKECWAWTWCGIGFWALWGGFFFGIASALDFFKFRESAITDFLFNNVFVYSVICTMLTVSIFVPIVRVLNRRRGEQPGEKVSS